MTSIASVSVPTANKGFSMVINQGVTPGRAEDVFENSGG